MHRLYSIAVPGLLLGFTLETIPTIPTFEPLSPHSSGIVASSDGTVYFVDAFQNSVWRARPGEAPQVFVAGRRSRSLQLDAGGNLYGTHDDGTGSAVLWRADPSGAVIDLTRTPVGADDPQSFVVLESGEVVRWLGARRMPIAGVAQASGGDFIVTSGASVLRVSPTGRLTTVLANDPLLRPRANVLSRIFGDPAAHLTGVAVAPNGDIYVANRSRGALIRVDAHGRASDAYSNDRGWRPTGVAVAHGSVYVLEYGNGVRVRRIEADGSNSIVAAVRPARSLAAAPSAGRLTLRTSSRLERTVVPA